MLGLLACGKLAECTSFPLDDVTPEDLHDVDVYAATVAWRQLLGPLAAIGRDDLVATVRRKLRQHERATRTGLGARLRQAIRGLDRTVAAGRLRRFYHRWKARD